MNDRHRRLAVLHALAALVVMTACAKAPPPVAPVEPAPKPVEAHMTIAVTADANPDATGRPSPVVLRLYQLKADSAFKGADFFGLFDDEQQALGAELLSRTELVLAPSDLRAIDVALDADARFVGAVAAFRDIRNAQWRALVPTWPEGLKHLIVAVERGRIVVSLQDADNQHLR
jgi:type VI secretion system protein VasD